MNLTAKITSKGQVTIPVAVRKKLGIRTGERITFDYSQPGAVTFRRAPSASSSKGALVGKTNGKVATAADIREAISTGAHRKSDS